MRYARATDEFYVPAAEDVRTQVGKPGAYSFEPVDAELAETRASELKAVYEAAYRAYERLVEQGVARELARAVLPGRGLHGVLLDGQRAGPDELRLAAQLRDGAARDPPLRRGVRALPRERRCRSRTRRSSANDRTAPLDRLRPQQPHRVRAAARSLER